MEPFATLIHALEWLRENTPSRDCGVKYRALDQRTVLTFIYYAPPPALCAITGGPK